MLPSVLYHGSMYQASILKPGFEHTQEEVTWDVTESNRYLYATTEKDTAILLGFASAIEHTYGLDYFHTQGNEIVIDLAPDKNNKKQIVKLDQLLNLPVYLYEIRPTGRHHWEHNKNEQNKLDTEWKSNRHILPSKVEKIDIRKHFKDYKIVV